LKQLLGHHLNTTQTYTHLELQDFKQAIDSAAASAHVIE
jgi:site-specific recombinase XerC